MKKLNSKLSVEGMAEKEGLTPLDKMLIVAYCKEMTATLQYQCAYHQGRGDGIIDARDEYTKHQKDEMDHADEWLKRLEEKGVVIRLDYATIQATDEGFVHIATSSVKEQLAILIKSEESSRDYYGQIVERAREDKDWITERIAKEYMATEEEHANDLRRILEQL